MEKNKKIFVVSLATVIMFFISFLFLLNDIINYFIVFMTITAILFVHFCYIVFSKKDDTSVYKRNLKKILKTYDSILVYSDSGYEISKHNIIFVKKFEDLLTAQEEFECHIVFIEEKESSIFLLKDNNELLVYVMKVNDDVTSKFENKLIENIQKEKEKNKKVGKNVLEDLEKTTIIQLKNDKVYKVSPLNK